MINAYAFIAHHTYMLWYTHRSCICKTLMLDMTNESQILLLLSQWRPREISTDRTRMKTKK